MDIKSARYMKIIGCAVYIFLAAAMSSCLCSCSSEKTGEMEIAKESTSEKAAIQPPDVRPKEAFPPSSAIDETIEKGSERTSPHLPGVVKAKLQLENRADLDLIKVIAEGSDHGGNPVTFTYEWTKNGEPAGEGDSISGFKRGDKLSVKITPYDGKEYGIAKVLTTEIKNTPPKIIEHKELNFDGKIYTYQVKATDPDGDALTYSLKSAPSGMSIHPTTGLIQWNVPPDFVGKKQVTVLVSDGNGGEATYTFEAAISIEKTAK